MSQPTKLHQLFEEQGQSPWLDNLTRSYPRDGALARVVADGDPGGGGQPDDLRAGHRGARRR